MSAELSSQQQDLLNQLGNSILRKNLALGEFNEIGSADSASSIGYEENLTERLVDEAENLKIPFPLLAKIIVAAMSPNQRGLTLSYLFLFNEGRITLSETVDIAKELGIKGFDLGNWLE